LPASVFVAKDKKMELPDKKIPAVQAGIMKSKKIRGAV